MITSLISDLLSPLWAAILLTAGYNAVITLGLYLSNSAGALSVAHAAIAGMGGYAGAIVTTNFGLPFGVAIAAGALTGLIAGVVVSILTLRMSAIVASLATLALGEMMVVVTFNTPYLGGSSSFYGIPRETTLENVLLVLALATFVIWRLDGSSLGYAARATRSNPLAAAALGVHVPKVKITVFALGAALAAIGGVLRAHYLQVQNPGDLAFALSLTFLIFWVLGGSFSYWGAIVGAIVLTVAPELFRFAVYQRYILFGLLVTVAMILRPEGLITRRSLGESAPLRELLHWMKSRGGP